MATPVFGRLCALLCCACLASGAPARAIPGSGTDSTASDRQPAVFETSDFGVTQRSEVGPHGVRTIRRTESSSGLLREGVVHVPASMDFPAAFVPALMQGSSGVSLQFFPNGEAVEVDGPNNIAYSPDGLHILIAARGSAVGAASLSVYDATTLSLQQVIPLSGRPIDMEIVPGTTKVVIANDLATQDSMTSTLSVVDYALGTETATIALTGVAGSVSVSPDGSLAAVTGPFFAPGSVSVVLIDLLTNTQTAVIPGFKSINTTAGSNWGYQKYGTKARFLPSGDEVFVLGGPPGFAFDLAILDLTTETVTASFPLSAFAFGAEFAYSGNGSVAAATFVDAFAGSAKLMTMDSATLTSHFTGLGNVTIVSPPLVRLDGSKAVGCGFTTPVIMDTATGATVNVDVSGFDYNRFWAAATNIGNSYFLLWFDGGGDYGYQVIDWETGARVAELVAPDLQFGVESVVLTALNSPIHDTRVAFFDAFNVQENLALLDLNPADPQVLVDSKCGDAIEGDAAFGFEVSADKSTALLVNYVSSNACFVDLATMTKSNWTDLPHNASDMVLTPDGATAAVAAAYLYPIPDFAVDPRAGFADHILLIDRATGTTTEVTLPPDTFARSLALSPDGTQLFTMLLNFDMTSPGQVARIDLATGTLDPNTVTLSTRNPSWGPWLTGIQSNLYSALTYFDDDHTWAAISPDGQLLAVSSVDLFVTGQGLITLIDLLSWSIMAEVTVPGPVPAMQFDSTTSNLFVLTFPLANPQGTIERIEINGAASAVAQSAMLVEGFAPYDLLLTPGESDLLVFGRADALFTGDGRSMFSFDTTMLTQQAGITFPVLNNLGFQYPPPFINYFAGTTHVRSSADGDTMLIFADNGDIHRFDPASKTVIESVTTGFLAPTGVFSTESSHAGSLLDESFVLASFHEFNDGLARLTLTSTVCSNVCGDLDGDEDVDAGDFDIFVMAFGLAMDDPGYDRCADYDDDVAITLVDYQNWLLCYQDFTGDPGAPAPALPNMGDFDRDNDVDLVDFADFQSCVAGGASPLLCGAQFDFNDDGDVTEADMSGFSLLLAGPAAP